MTSTGEAQADLRTHGRSDRHPDPGRHQQRDDDRPENILRKARRGRRPDQRANERQNRHRECGAHIRPDLAQVSAGRRCRSEHAGHLVGSQRLNTGARKPEQQGRHLEQPTATGDGVDPSGDQRREGQPDQDVEIDHDLRPNEGHQMVDDHRGVDFLALTTRPILHFDHPVGQPATHHDDRRHADQL